MYSRPQDTEHPQDSTTAAGVSDTPASPDQPKASQRRWTDAWYQRNPNPLPLRKCECGYWHTVRTGPVPICIFGTVPFQYCGKRMGGCLVCFLPPGHIGASLHYRAHWEHLLYDKRAPKPERFGGAR